MMMRQCSWLLIFSLLLVSFPALSQPVGKNFVRTYDLTEIGSTTGAFWSVVQDSRGLLYFGGEKAVFEFDGTSWRSIELPNKSVVRSLAVGLDSIIYVGGVSEFGYLSADSAGKLQYVSLIGKVPEDKLNFPDIWSINILGNAVCFQSADLLFIYEKGKIRTVDVHESYHRSVAIDDRLYFNQADIGLCYLYEEKPYLLPGGEFFSDMVISSITRYGENKLLIGTRRNGLFLYDLSPDSRTRITPFISEVSDFVREYQLYHGIELPGNRFAFATLRNGTIITDQDGNIQTYVNNASSLGSFNSYFLYLSNESELWITSARGISLYNINSALTFWDEELGLVGGTNCTVEFRDRIYAGTYTGIFEMDLSNRNRRREPGQTTRFRETGNLNTEVWSFMIFNPDGPSGPEEQSRLLAATGQGIYNIGTGQVEFTTDRVGQLTFCQSSRNPSVIYLNAHPSFYVLQFRNGRWNVVWEKEVSSYVISTVEDHEGNVWLGTMYYGVYKIGLEKVFSDPAARISRNLDPGLFRDIEVKNYGMEEGLPGLNMAFTHLYHDQLIITCEGVYTYDPKSDRITRATSFGQEVEKWDKTMPDFEEDSYGNIWGFQNQIFDKQPMGQFIPVSLPYRVLTISGAAQSYYHDHNGCTWIGGESALFRFDSRISRSTFKPPFTAMIRKVMINADSLIFGGAFFTGSANGKNISAKQPSGMVPYVPFSARSIAFEFSCPYFQDDIPLHYSYMLEGYDDRWSEWSGQTFKEYNNLRENEYVFKVRAMNYAGDISQEASFRFVITPPWQRTLAAYIIFTLLAIIIVYSGIRAYVYRLKILNIQLENQVRERTHELERQKEEIRNQSVKLKTQNDKLIHQRNRMSEMSKEILKTNRDKLRFFTNISHELRNPLTLVLGPIEELRSKRGELSDEQIDRKYEVIIKNARRLLALVNQILDFRKIEINRPTLSASEGELVGFVREITSCFRELANKKEISLEFVSTEKEIRTWFDPDKVEKIIINLLSNAFKYTDQGGRVTVSISTTTDWYSNSPEGRTIKIEVEDTGIGISQDLIPKIFDRFYHSGRSVTLEQAGSGIGLSMVASLAEIHHGKVDVESELGKGSRFIFTLPLGESYLKEGEKENNPEQSYVMSLKDKPNIELVDHIHVSTRKKNTTVDKNSEKDLILIVEDNEEIRSYIISVLQETYDFIEADDGDEGFELAKLHGPSVIISDIIMPNMDGYEFCQKIKSTLETSHIPVILLTSKNQDEDHRQGLEVGADDFISKPFNMSILEARIENLIQAGKRLRELFRTDMVYKPADIIISSTDEKFLSKAFQTVEKYMADPEFGVDLFAREMAMSQSTLYRKLKALTDLSTNNFIKEFRLKQAAKVLENNDVSVSEVSILVGFDDPAYFAKSFKQKFGKSPSEYHKSKK
ncbi:MAG: ATP-binding protein [Bacteroidota bacterium]